MKRLALFCLFLGFFPAFAAAETITIVADEWCPYNCGEKDAKPGYMVEIIRAAMKKSHIDVVYKVMPWKEAIEKTRAGTFDAIVGANTGDAPDFIYPDQLQGISINQAWVKSDATWEYKDTSSLEGLRIAVVEGYSYGKEIDAYLRNRQAMKSTDIMVNKSQRATQENIEALLAGKVDVLLEDKNVIEYYFASRGQPLLLKPAGNPVSVNRSEDTFVFVAFGPNKPKAGEYANKLGKAMLEMRQNGELAAILADYHMDGIFRYIGNPALRP